MIRHSLFLFRIKAVFYKPESKPRQYFSVWPSRPRQYFSRVPSKVRQYFSSGLAKRIPCKSDSCLGYLYNVESILVKGHSTSKAVFSREPQGPGSVFKKGPKSKAVFQRKVPRVKQYSKERSSSVRQYFTNQSQNQGPIPKNTSRE